MLCRRTEPKGVGMPAINAFRPYGLLDLSWTQRPLRLTALAAQVLAGQAHWLDHNPAQRWVKCLSMPRTGPGWSANKARCGSANSPLKPDQVTRWMAPALPVFAGMPAPTGTDGTRNLHHTCGSGFTREAGDTIYGTALDSSRLKPLPQGTRTACGFSYLRDSAAQRAGPVPTGTALAFRA